MTFSQDGVAKGKGERARKVNRVETNFISTADRDHLCPLPASDFFIAHAKKATDVTARTREVRSDRTGTTGKTIKTTRGRVRNNPTVDVSTAAAPE